MEKTDNEYNKKTKVVTNLFKHEVLWIRALGLFIFVSYQRLDWLVFVHRQDIVHFKDVFCIYL